MAQLVGMALPCISVFACDRGPDESRPTIDRDVFAPGVDKFTLKAGEYECTVITWGATMISFLGPDRDGNVDEMTLGFNSLSDYQGPRNQYFGCTVGRVAGRIRDSEFTVKGTKYQVTPNNGPNCLHGGAIGLDKVIWTAEPRITTDEIGVKFSYSSKDGDEGFPGDVDFSTEYILQLGGTLVMRHTAKCRSGAGTPVNMTNHTYWNMSGGIRTNVMDHHLSVHASHFLPTGDDLLPTGEIRELRTLACADFSKEKQIKTHMSEACAAGFGGGGATAGYDNFYVIDRAMSEPRRPRFHNDVKLYVAGGLRSRETGRRLEVWTDQAGVVMYTGNFLGQDGGTPDTPGTDGFRKHDGVCLETQNYPDALSHGNFPSIILEKDQKYSSTTVIQFSVSDKW